MEIIIMVFQVIGIIIGILIVLFVLELAIVAFVPGFLIPKQRLEKTKEIPEDVEKKPSWPRKDVSFKVKGTLLSAWLYLPENLSAPVPCIVMGHGLGGTKAAGLESYAIRFQESGFAVFVFDYRHLGESEGEPRQLIWIPYQLEDYSAAVNYARSLKEINPARIALWGTSLSGGHVIVIAARDENIACISSQVPLLDGRVSALMAQKHKIIGIRHGLRMIMHGQRDLVRSWFGLSPHKIPIAGKQGTMAVLPVLEAYEALGKLAPDDFVNEACARINIRIDKYRPVKHTAKVRCPVLLQICDKDIGTPKSVVEKAEKRLGKLVEVIRYPIDHFDIYSGSDFEKSVIDQLDFFKKHL
ncbi:MAG: alpha/beta fold hydrolase [Candidatus Aminicenantes bacterium]|nr:alpha/beta fold hydrolase [Candidatus Aminicenantes bacterium]